MVLVEGPTGPFGSVPVRDAGAPKPHVVIESLGPGEPVGWSWLFRPYIWHFGAEAMTPVRTHEFDAAAVRMMMDADPAFGSAIGHWVGRVLAMRLQQTRIRLLDLYAPRLSATG